MVFDTIAETSFENRYKLLKSMSLPSHVTVVDQTLCTGDDHFKVIFLEFSLEFKVLIFYLFNNLFLLKNIENKLIMIFSLYLLFI